MLTPVTDGLFDWGPAHNKSHMPSGAMSAYDFSDTSSGLHPVVGVRVPHPSSTHPADPVGMYALQRH